MTSTMVTLYKVEWSARVKSAKHAGGAVPKVVSRVYTVRERRAAWDCPGLFEFFSHEDAARAGWHPSAERALAAAANAAEQERADAERRAALLFAAHAAEVARRAGAAP